MAKVDIWMPVFIGDYLRDTQELDAEEHGAYMLLLMHYWLKKGDIGSDVKRLSRVARSTEEITAFILNNYFTLTEHGYRNKRADEEMLSAESRRASAAENGKKGGRPSKQNPDNNPEETHGLNEGKPEQNPEESSSSSSSSSSPERSPTEQDTRRSVSVRIDSAIKHWNSQPNLPPCKYKSATLPDAADVIVKFDTFSEEEIQSAITSLNKCWKQIEKRYRPSSFHRFLIRSLDSWLPSVHPEDKYLEKKQSGIPTWIPPDTSGTLSREKGREIFSKVVGAKFRKGNDENHLEEKTG